MAVGLSDWKVGSGVESRASQNPRTSHVQSCVIRVPADMSMQELCLIGLWLLAGSVNITLVIT